MPRARGLDAPAGVLATAAPDRSPLPPELRSPRRGARLHRILITSGARRRPRSRQTRRLFVRGHRVRVCVSGALRRAPLPQQLGLRGFGVRGTQRAEGIPPLPQVLGVHGRGQVWQARGPGLRGFGPHCSFRSSVSPPEKKHTRAAGVSQGARGLPALLLPPLAAFASSAPCGSSAVWSWAGGASLGRRGEYREAKPEAQSEGAGDTTAHPSFRPSPSSLCFQESPLPLSSEETRRLSQSLQSGKLRPSEAGRGLPPPRGWGRRTGCAGQLEDAPSPNSADPTGQGTAGRGLPGLNETRVWRRPAEGPRRHSRQAASMPGTRMRPPPLAARAPSDPSWKGGSDNQKRKYVSI